MYHFLTKLVLACLVLLGDSAIAGENKYFATGVGDAFSVAQSPGKLPDKKNDFDSSDTYVATIKPCNLARSSRTTSQFEFTFPAPLSQYQTAEPRAPPVRLPF